MYKTFVHIVVKNCRQFVHVQNSSMLLNMHRIVWLQLGQLEFIKVYSLFAYKISVQCTLLHSTVYCSFWNPTVWTQCDVCCVQCTAVQDSLQCREGVRNMNRHVIWALVVQRPGREADRSYRGYGWLGVCSIPSWRHSDNFAITRYYYSAGVFWECVDGSPGYINREFLVCVFGIFRRNW